MTSGPAIYVNTNYYHEFKTTLLCSLRYFYLNKNIFLRGQKKQTFSDNGIPFTFMQTWLLDLCSKNCFELQNTKTIAYIIYGGEKLFLFFGGGGGGWEGSELIPNK